MYFYLKSPSNAAFSKWHLRQKNEKRRVRSKSRVIDLLEVADIGDPMLLDKLGMQRMGGVGIQLRLVGKLHGYAKNVITFWAHLAEDFKFRHPWDCCQCPGRIHERGFLRRTRRMAQGESYSVADHGGHYRGLGI